jgi:hypothetical protein
MLWIICYKNSPEPGSQSLRGSTESGDGKFLYVSNRGHDSITAPSHNQWMEWTATRNGRGNGLRTGLDGTFVDCLPIENGDYP